MTHYYIPSHRVIGSLVIENNTLERVFTIYGHVSHLGNVTHITQTNAGLSNPCMLLIGHEVIEKVFEYNGHVTGTIYTDFRFPFPSLPIEAPREIWLDWSSGLGEEEDL